MLRIILALLLAGWAAVAGAQNTATSFKSTEVSPGIYVLAGADGFGGGNMALVIGKDFVAMIDDGIEPLAPTLLAKVKQLAGRPVNFIINTHLHGDHAGGNAHFAENAVVIFGHDNIRSRLVLDATPAGGSSGLPVVTFAEGINFHLGGIAAEVLHLPRAHTDGDAAIFFPEVNVLHTGDIFFNQLFPFIDLDNGGSVDGYIAAQRKLLEMTNDQTKIIPGHGDIASKAELERDLQMLIDCRSRIAALFDSGESEEEIVAANPLADYHDAYNWGFITTELMTRTLYRALARGN
ncbi:MAG TPA: MBL fold metallo-hydrolase [Woeseiaceae bacterium]|nr:MBL fold metallo-hydrolase [Woeseiaceae bacterium]